MDKLKDMKRMKLSPGDILIIKPDRKLDEDEKANLNRNIKSFSERTRVHVALIDHDFQVFGVKASEREDLKDG